MPIFLVIGSLGIVLAAIVVPAVRIFSICLRAPGVCPRCGSPAIRSSSSRGLRASMATAFRFERYRCRACKAGFSLTKATLPAAGTEADLIVARKSDRVTRSRRRDRMAAPYPPVALESDSAGAMELTEIGPVSTEVRIVRKSHRIRRRRRGMSERNRKTMLRISWAVPCAGILAFALLWRPAPPVLRRASAAAAMPIKPITLAPQPLEVAEAGFSDSGGERRISGSVRNKDKLPYNSVEIIFSAWDGHKSRLGLVTATISVVYGGATASFQTEPVPAGTKKYELRSLTGTHP